MSRLSNAVVVCFLSLMAKDALTDEDFCDPTLCPENVSHIGCKHTTNFSHKCPREAHLLKMTERLKSIILKEHNRYRDLLARGDLNGLPVAANMLAMEWDETLEYLAELNVKQCKLKNSNCFATSQFITPGQNIAYSRYRDEQNPRQIIKGQIKMWFDEYLKADIASLITAKVEKKNMPLEIAHFLQMARDNASQIGCAISLYDSDDCHYQLMACFYSDTFKPCEPTYQMGRKPGENCENGKHPKYTNLCVSSVNMVVTPIPRGTSREKSYEVSVSSRKSKNKGEGGGEGEDKGVASNLIDWIKNQNNGDDDISIEMEHKESLKSKKNQLHLAIGNDD